MNDHLFCLKELKRNWYSFYNLPKICFIKHICYMRINADLWPNSKFLTPPVGIKRESRGHGVLLAEDEKIIIKNWE